MPRKPRLTVVGAVHHVMSRGIEGTDIFRSDQDRAVFCKLLEQQLQKSGYLLYAWALMPNHYHLVLRVNEYPLGRFMRLLNGEYARWFRKNSEKRGYLFQDRYKSIVTQDQQYVEELLRYVHLNPLRAKICSSLQNLSQYPWCGHGALMGLEQRLRQNIDDVLRRFGTTRKAQIAAYEAFLQKGLDQEPETFREFRKANKEVEDQSDPACWVIGNREFVEKALSSERNHKIKVQQYVKKGITLEFIAKETTEKFNIDAGALLVRGKKNSRSEARRRFARTAYLEYGFSVMAIARFLAISSPAVSKMIWRPDAKS